MARRPLDEDDDKLSTRTTQKMGRKGLKLRSRPEDDMPDLPANLTELNDDKLMELFVELTRWAEYAGTQLAAAAVDEKDAEAHLERCKAMAAVKAKNEKSVTAQKAAAASDEEVLDADAEYRKNYAVRKLTEAIYSGADRKAAVVSRELTRRIGRSDRESRVTRWSA
jgi:hypothetical protein